MIGLLAQMARTQHVGVTQDTDIAGTAMTGVRSAPFWENYLDDDDAELGERPRPSNDKRGRCRVNCESCKHLDHIGPTRVS